MLVIKRDHGIVVKERKDGTKVYCIEYYFKGRRKMEHVGSNRRQAERLLSQRRYEIAEGKFFDNKSEFPRVLFRDFAFGEFDRYHVSKKRTAEKYRTFLRSLCQEFGHRCLDDITELDIERYRSRRLETISSRIKRPVSKVTVNREIQILRILYNKAVSWGKVEKNPVTVKLFKEKPRDKILQVDEVQHLIAAAEEPTRSIIILAVHTGMRKSEILGLRWDQISFRETCIKLQETKNQEPREIPLNGALVEILKSNVLTRSRFNRGFVFCHEDGSPLKDFRKSFASARRISGIDEDFRFHDLRHTWASHLVMSGEPVQVVMELGGWKTTSMLKRYTTISKERRQEAANTAHRIFAAGDLSATPLSPNQRKLLSRQGESNP
ncbi:tyrosine-type recombinase/integrase [Acidobacteriota bacterium]